MKCAQNPSYGFSHFIKLRQSVGLPSVSTDVYSQYAADDENGSDVFVNAAAALHGDEVSNASVEGGGGDAMTTYRVVEMYIYTVVIPAICLVGIVGNSVNLMALASIVRNKPIDRMERSATVGLLALAVSDLFFCAVVLPLAFVDHVQVSVRLTSALIYHVYHPAIISTLITSSTWLTVVMAVSRYLAICHPLKARIIIGMRFATGSIVGAFLFSVLLNVPRFLHSAIACVSDERNRTYYFPLPGLLQRHAALDQTYYVLYLVVGILLPLVILAYSNFFLIRAIRNSRKMRSQFQRRTVDTGKQDEQHHPSQSDPTNVLTLTLTVIVIMYAVLVSPAEISNIFTNMINTYLEQKRQRKEAFNNTDSDVHSGDEAGGYAAIHQDSYNLAVAVGNTLQTLNFACNFVLYCAVNSHFRLIVRQMATCRPWWRWTPSTTSRSTGATTIHVSRCANSRHVEASVSLMDRGSQPRAELSDCDIEATAKLTIETVQQPTEQ